MSYQGKKQHLMDRIKRICLQTPTHSTSTSTKAGLALLLLLGMAVVSWANLPSAEDPLMDPSIEAFTIELPSPAVVEEPSPVALPITKPTTPAGDKEVPVSSPQVRSQKVKQDTVPPRIPKMGNAPDLPSPPDISSTSKQISSALKKKSGDRSELRASIDQYREAIDKWQGSVQKEYLSLWNDRRKEVKMAYKDWLGQLGQEYGTDIIRHSIALQDGSRAFEDKLNEHERAINKSEESLNKGLEDQIRSLEDGFRKYEDKQAEHRERMEYHRDRMSLHNLRMSIHNTRMDLHRERMNLHRDRMDIHRDRMDAHRKIMAAFKEEFFPELIKDGFIKNAEDDIEIRAKGDSVWVNDKELPAQQAQKYLKMIHKYGFEVPEKGEWIYHKDGGNQTFGTSIRSRSKEE